MSYRVVLTAKAEEDIASVLEWFRDQRATEAGGRWLVLLKSKLDVLATHPERCNRAAESDEIGEDIRELILGRGPFKHRILFRCTQKTVYFLRLWHSSRDAITPSEVGPDGGSS